MFVVSHDTQGESLQHSSISYEIHIDHRWLRHIDGNKDSRTTPTVQFVYMATNCVGQSPSSDCQIPQLVNNCPAFYETHNLIILFRTSHHLSLS